MAKSARISDFVKGPLRAHKNTENPGFCKYCGKKTTYHHYYCDECYPQEMKTIHHLTVENIELRHKVKELENQLKAHENKNQNDG